MLRKSAEVWTTNLTAPHVDIDAVLPAYVDTNAVVRWRCCRCIPIDYHIALLDDGLAYVKDGDVWLATPDGARQQQVTHTGTYSYVSQADDGTLPLRRGSLTVDDEGLEVTDYLTGTSRYAGWGELDAVEIQSTPSERMLTVVANGRRFPVAGLFELGIDEERLIAALRRFSGGRYRESLVRSDAPARAIGGHALGCLAGGVALPADGPGYQVMRPSRGRFYGHPALVDFIGDLARSARNARARQPAAAVVSVSAGPWGTVRLRPSQDRRTVATTHSAVACGSAGVWT